MNYSKQIGNKLNEKIAVAMSGGVDSAVAAILLIKESCQVVGITGIMHDKMEEEAKNAFEICNSLGIEHHIVDLRDEFNKTVVKYFEDNYKQGLTPNPCTCCNKLIKWGSLAGYAFEKLKADFFATGHYARILNQNGSFCLYRGEDLKKDQSYMLFALTQEQLSKTLFPLGNYNKIEIRQIAENNNLRAAYKKESQDVCFICPPETTQSYLIGRFGEKEGEITDYETGKVLGTHKGAFNYTIGQRKGIGIAASEPLYVISVDPEQNRISVGFKELLSRQEFDVIDVNWQQENELQKLPAKQRKHSLLYKDTIHESSTYKCGLATSAFYTPASQQNEFAEKSEFSAMVKIRYNSAAQEAVVSRTGENSVHVKFKEPKFAITPGQAAVFYDMNNEYVLGGGWIRC